MQPVSVQVDDRESRASVIRYLREHVAVNVSVIRLVLGDYRVDRRALLERKTIRDFALSIVDGRLFRQAQALAASDQQVALILEGAKRDAEGLGVSREAIQGAMITVGVLFGVPILRSCGPEESARLIVYLGRQLARRVRGAGYRAGWKPRSQLKRQLFVLQGLPGIGSGRARSLLERFGSVRGVMNADEEALMSVNGVGRATANGIARVVNGGRAPSARAPP